MSDGYTPKPRTSSGEFAMRLGMTTTILGGFVAIAVVIVGLILFVGSRASDSETTSKLQAVTDASKHRDDKLREKAREYADGCKDAISKLREDTRAHTASTVAQALAAHSAVGAHHNVAPMIRNYAVSLVDFAQLKSRVDQQESLNAEWRREIKGVLKDIKASLRDLSDRMPRRNRHKLRQSVP